jgi:DNA-binding beta-propeller fold protein YncE
MSIRKLILTVPAVFIVLTAALLLSSVPAQALVKHEYLSQITGLVDPKGITVGPNSDLYVADAGGDTVDRFTEDGIPLPFSATEPYVQGGRLTGTPNGPFGGPQDVAVDNATGQVYVADSSVVDIFSASGEYLSQITEPPLSAPVNGPFPDGAAGLAVDQATNNLYITARGFSNVGQVKEVVTIFNSSDEYLSQIELGLESPYGQPDAGNVVLSELTGNMYVLDVSAIFGKGGVEVFDASGIFVPRVWSGSGTLAGPFSSETTSLGIDELTGQLYVADAAQKIIYEFGPSVSETYEGELTSTQSGPFDRPQGVAVSPVSGDVYVADASGVVDIFGPGIAIKPVISSESFSAVESRAATLNARVLDGETPANYHFEYGPTDAYGSQTTTVRADGTISAAAQLEDLIPGTEYHFRLIVENEVGTEIGSDTLFKTLPSATQSLPDNRAYEMVTPIDKENVEVYVPDARSHESEAGGYNTTRLTQVAVTGDAVVYQGDPTRHGGAESSGNGLGSAYLAKRSSKGGWSQTGIEPPGRRLSEYRGFSSDLSTGVVSSPTENPELAESQLPGEKAPTGSFDQEEGGRYKEYFDLYKRSMGEENYEPLFTEIPSRTPTELGSIFYPDDGGFPGPVYAGASADFNHLLFAVNDALLEGEGALEKELKEDVKHEIENFELARFYLYDWSNGHPALIDVLPEGTVAQNAMFGAPHSFHSEAGTNPPDFSHVISANGSRVFWTSLEGVGYGQRPKALYVRENPSQPQSPINGHDECTVPVDACTIQLDKEVEGGGRFWSASSDGSKVFFTKGGLYEYEVNSIDGRPGTLTDLTPGVEVQGVAAISEDGDYIYYVDNAGELHMLHENDNRWEAPTSIAALSTQDGREIEPIEQSVGNFQNGEGEAGDWVPDIGQRTAEVTPDGQGFVFMSNQSLKTQGFPDGYQNSGQEETYVYDAKDKSLFCASCSQSGELGSEGFLPVSWSDSYIPTLVSEDGSRVFFDSGSSLVSRDTNGKLDVYEWEREGTGTCGRGEGARGGCIYILSGGASNESSWLLGASVSGSDVFMITRADLTPEAEDELYKVFDARVEGVKPVAPPACTGTGCQGVPAPPPTFATPSSVTYAGVGNFTQVTPVRSVVKVKSKPLTLKQKLAKALKQCEVKPKLRVPCESRARRRYGQKAKTKKTLNSRGRK